MNIILEELPHQLEALKAIDKNYPSLDYSDSSDNLLINPLLENAYTNNANLDIKMETGTGKTYVYTRMIYELNKTRGLFKFIIVVPTPSIKEGTKKFIESDYAQKHFRELYGNKRIQLSIINAGDFPIGNKKRTSLPIALTEFIESSRANENQIQVLLINSGMLSSKSMEKIYDQTLLNGYSQPFEALSAIRPVVIIDEPHRFSKTNKTYKSILKLKPQSIIRFGATFPIEKKNKVECIYYYRGEPQYDLNAVQSFNQGLVKGVEVIYPDLPEDKAKNMYTVYSFNKKELVLKNTKGQKRYISSGENLGVIDSGFEGDIHYLGSNKDEGLLSNDLTLHKGMKLIPDTFTTNYQEQLIKQAIEQHFIKEQENFFRVNNSKIKTLSLFFIDSKNSYGNIVDGKREKGWLIKIFENELLQKLNQLIDKYADKRSDREREYLSFLKATKKSLMSEHQNVYAGYFSGDKNSKDEDIQKEVDDILSNKEKMISFKDANGSWITRRFFFSKWTLREGWDNPNVFVITKLRTSGSENSKIQEVGRGLRLPVDEFGNRVTQDTDEFYLSFIIGYDERDFVEKLQSEVNKDTFINMTKITDDMIDIICHTYDKDIAEVFLEIANEQIIDKERNYINNGFNKLCEMYPIINDYVVSKDKIIDKDTKTNRYVNLKVDYWNEFKDLWLQLSKRQMIVYDNKDQELNKIIQEVFLNKDNYEVDYLNTKKQRINIENNQAQIIEENHYDYDNYNTMKYGEFLKQFANKTSISPQITHKNMLLGMKNVGNDNRYINRKTLENLVLDYKRRFIELYKDNYSYKELDFHTSTPIYDYEKNEFMKKIPSNVLGVKTYNSCAMNKYLYDNPPMRYDSEQPELDILKVNYDNTPIAYYGKLPKQAIKIPKYDSGTTTPDFIFKLSNKDKYLIVETKSRNMRDSDKLAVNVQDKFFENYDNINYRMATSESEIQNYINELYEQ